MRIIKPYGRSHVEDSKAGKKRALRLNSDPRSSHDIAAFAASHDALVIAQWISIIDKIATKPPQEKKPTEAQFTLRKGLGAAAWAIISEKRLLSEAADTAKGSDAPSLHNLWKSKIAPYGDGGKFAKDNGKISPRGRWYGCFVGDCNIDEVDVRAVAEKIYNHLYVGEYTIAMRRGPKRQGLIAARADSIAKNIVHPPVLLQTDGVPDARKANDAWNANDEKKYAGVDVAKEIYAAAKENIQKKGAHRRVFPSCAASLLYVYYGRLFKDDAGAPLSIAAAKRDCRGLFNLHMAVKDAYTRILKGSKKKGVPPLLPQNSEALFALVRQKRVNRDLNALVRLGKIIHYQRHEYAGGTTRNADPKNEVVNSPFWTSDGQAEIKRNEAFVRVWRHVLALAGATLKDWADPNGRIQDDILGRDAIGQAVDEKHFCETEHRKKLPLLFGARADLFSPVQGGSGQHDGSFPESLLRFALEKTASLRH